MIVSSVLSLAAGAVAWELWIQSRAPARLEFFHPADEPATARVNSMNRPIAPQQAEEWRYFVPAELANRMFPIEAQQQDYDPWSYFRQRANLLREEPWEEHEGGHWTLRTNDMGLREDRPLALPRSEVRVLVTGDSHTDGVCNNDESFANRLEFRLQQRLGGKSVEVLNAGLGGYTLFNYFGVLLREAEFEPQVFVVAVYGGNDFVDLIRLEHRFQASPATEWPKAELDRRNAALLTAPYAMGQCLNQVQTFLSVPPEKDVAIGCALRLCSEMQAVCAQRGIAMVVVFVPAACSCTWKEPHPDIERARAELGLTAADGGINAELAQRFTSGVRGLEIPLLDMRESFEQLEDPPYWRLDLHLSLEGQRLIAEALEPLVLTLLQSREATRPR